MTGSTPPTGTSEAPPLTGAIDVHAHAVPPRYRAAMAAAGVTLPDGVPSGFPDWSPESALALMDAVGVAASVLSISSPGVLLDDDPAGTVRLAAATNDELAAARDGAPDRFGVVASLPLPDVTAALAEATRALDDLGADGISLLTNYAGTYLADPALEPLYGELDERGAVVVVHPTSPACWEATSPRRPRPMLEFMFDTTRAVVDLLLSGVFDRHPGIRWVIPHGGAVLPVLADRVEGVTRGFDAYEGREHLDVHERLRRLHYDLAGDVLPRALPALVDLVGAGQLVYGTDTPFTPGFRVAANAAALAGTPLLTDSAAAFRGNAAALFPRLAGS
jgi:6-methylsalicylate decarboxylase